MAPFRIEQLSSDHDRNEFNCGLVPLNDYLVKQVGQDTRRRVTACFVAIEIATERLVGYYSLSAGSVALSDLPDKTAKRLPRYPNLPIIRIGRLAVDVDFQGQQLGKALLFDALRRSVRSDIAAFAAVVDAKDDNSARFYERFGFQRLSASAHANVSAAQRGYQEPRRSLMNVIRQDYRLKRPYLGPPDTDLTRHRTVFVDHSSTIRALKLTIRARRNIEEWSA